ncbi:MAG: peptidoglycan recognition protein family protein [Planctomycetota bacterium]
MPWLLASIWPERMNGCPHDEPMHPSSLPPGGHDTLTTSRRLFLQTAMLAGLAGLLPGCGASSRHARNLPGPAWPDVGSDPTLAPAAPVPSDPGEVAGAVTAQYLPRSAWAKGAPTVSRMRRQDSVRYVTIHHSAGPVFHATDQGSTAAHLESIRRYHHGTRGWGDIGYHFAVDRAGRVWECRPLHWQGAHVRDHNLRNVGLVALGNFDEQRPTNAQLVSLQTHARWLMHHYRVPATRLRTHQEWAPTACPGRYVQRYVTANRSNGVFG